VAVVPGAEALLGQARGERLTPERAETEAFADLYAAAPADVAAELGIASARIGGAECGTVRALGSSRIVNRVMGLGLDVAATEADLDALYTNGGTGWLGFAATLPAYRRRGAQTALLAARIRRAAELDCRTLFTETGEAVEGRPSNSYRNLLRAGFEPLYVRPNYRSPA